MLERTSPACRECLGIPNPVGQLLASCRRANTPSSDPLEQDTQGVCPALSSETHWKTWLHIPSLLSLLPLATPCHSPGLPGGIHSKLTCTRVLVSRLHLGNPAHTNSGPKPQGQNNHSAGRGNTLCSLALPFTHTVLPSKLWSWRQGHTFRTISHPNGVFSTKRRYFIFHLQNGAHLQSCEFKA